MKYTEAWASITSQNLNLKIATLILGILSIVLGMTTFKLSFKDAIVIERGCFSKALIPVSDQHDKNEIEAFLKESLAQRFDSLARPVDGLLSPDELKFRQAEQKEFDSKNMKQRIVVNGITEDKEGFKVDADRIISVGNIRSAFKFPLLVKLESKPRSYSNQYGLLVVTTKLIEDKPSDQKDNK